MTSAGLHQTEAMGIVIYTGRYGRIQIYSVYSKADQDPTDEDLDAWMPERQ